MLRKIVNYQKELDKTIAEIQSSGEKRTLLLHACCGPCSSYVLEYLVKYFEITVLYYNPNIYPPEEYQRRLFELKDLYAKFPPALEGNVKVIEDSYNQEDFYKFLKTISKFPVSSPILTISINSLFAVILEKAL